MDDISAEITLEHDTKIQKARNSVRSLSLDRVPFWGIMFQTYLTPLVTLGFYTKLLYDDVPETRASESSEVVAKQLEETLNQDRVAGKKTDVWWAAIRTFKLPLIYAGFSDILAYSCQFSAPYIVEQLVIYFEDVEDGKDPSLGRGIGFAFLLAFATMSTTSLIMGKFYNLVTFSIRARIAVMQLLFEKLLHMSPLGMKDKTVGQLLNLVSNDSGRIIEVSNYFNEIYIAPLAISICVILLYIRLGIVAVVAIVLLLLLFPMQLGMAYLIRKNRAEILTNSDKRVKLVNEMLQGIRVIKLYAWEGAVRKAIAETREIEIATIRNGLVLRFINGVLLFLWPCIVTYCTLVFISLRDNSLTSAKVFIVLSFLNVIRYSIILLPPCHQSFVEVSVASKRMSHFLEGDELPQLPPLNRNAPITSQLPPIDDNLKLSSNESASEMKGGAEMQELSLMDSITHASTPQEKTHFMERLRLLRRNVQLTKRNPHFSLESAAFYWASRDDPDPPTLTDLKLDIRPGELIGVIGPVGVGKTSFLQGLLGEMRYEINSSLLNPIHLTNSPQRNREDGSLIPPTIPFQPHTASPLADFRGRVGYLAQDPWILNASFQENILLELPYDENKFQRVLKAASLESDIAILSDGVNTFIGEQGVNLSGGQKSRVAMARMLYRAESLDICLMDDPFSAVDVSVGRHMFNNCILDELKAKTRIVVLNSHLHTLVHFDRIIVLEPSLLALRHYLERNPIAAQALEERALSKIMKQQHTPTPTQLLMTSSESPSSPSNLTASSDNGATQSEISTQQDSPNPNVVRFHAMPDVKDVEVLPKKSSEAQIVSVTLLDEDSLLDAIQDDAEEESDKMVRPPSAISALGTFQELLDQQIDFAKFEQNNEVGSDAGDNDDEIELIHEEHEVRDRESHFDDVEGDSEGSIGEFGIHLQALQITPGNASFGQAMMSNQSDRNVLDDNNASRTSRTPSFQPRKGLRLMHLDTPISEAAQRMTPLHDAIVVAGGKFPAPMPLTTSVSLRSETDVERFSAQEKTQSLFPVHLDEGTPVKARSTRAGSRVSFGSTRSQKSQSYTFRPRPQTSSVATGLGITDVAATMPSPVATEDGVTRQDVLVNKLITDASKNAVNRSHGMLKLDNITGATIVGAKQYMLYFGAGTRGWRTVRKIGFVFLTTLIAQGLRTVADLWFSLWGADSPETPQSDHTASWWIKTGLCWICGCLFMLILRTFSNLVVATQASRTLHDLNFASVLRAPMVWFDVTPVGSIVNLFSKDCETIDTVLPGSLLEVLQQTLTLCAMVGLAIAVSPIFIALFVILSVAMYFVQKRFRPSVTQLKRLESAHISPVYASFGSAVRGVDSIRAYGLQDEFIQRNRRHLDRFSRYAYYYQLIQRWLSWRLDALASCFVLGIGVIAVLFRHSISPSVASLALVTSMQMLGLLQWNVRLFLMTEGFMTSVERLNELSSLPPEPNYITDPKVSKLLEHHGKLAKNTESQGKSEKHSNEERKSTFRSEKIGLVVAPTLSPILSEGGAEHTIVNDMPPVLSTLLLDAREIASSPSNLSDGDKIKTPQRSSGDDSDLEQLNIGSHTALKNRLNGWPWKGNIEFRNVRMSYRRDLPIVLNKLSFKLPAGKKLGVVGRTGAGKSSLLLVLFRMVEIATGSVLIDDVDIRNVGLGDLRSRMSIIPQQPVLFSGTVRYNLDPFGFYSDTEVYRALNRVGLMDKINSLEGGLEALVAEFGSNFSQGQRQLLCIARALLRNSPILVLDEATAAVDPHTDAAIQATIRECFSQCTIMTIAHRLETIVDYDFVLVLGPVDRSISNSTLLGVDENDPDELEPSTLEFGPPSELLQREGSVFRSMAMEGGQRVFQSLLSRSLSQKN